MKVYYKIKGADIDVKWYQIFGNLNPAFETKDEAKKALSEFLKIYRRKHKTYCEKYLNEIINSTNKFLETGVSAKEAKNYAIMPHMLRIVKFEWKENETDYEDNSVFFECIIDVRTNLNDFELWYRNQLRHHPR